MISEIFTIFVKFAKFKSIFNLEAIFVKIKKVHMQNGVISKKVDSM